MGNMIILFFIKKVVDLIIVPVSVILLKWKSWGWSAYLPNLGKKAWFLSLGAGAAAAYSLAAPRGRVPPCWAVRGLTPATAGASSAACSGPASFSRRVPDCRIAAARPFSVRAEHGSGRDINASLVPKGTRESNNCWLWSVFVGSGTFTIRRSLGPLSWVQREKGFVLSLCCSDSAFEKPALFLD